MGEKILWLIKTFALLFNRLLSAWLVTDANCSSTQLTVKLYPLWFSYILWLGVDSSRRRCRVSNTPHFSSFYRLCLFYVLYSRSIDSYCCHMPWQVTGDSSLHTLFHTIPPLMSLWLKGINSRNPILWESVFLLIVFRFTWLKWMFDLQVNVFVMFCCNNYKSIDNPLTIHWQIHCAQLWSGVENCPKHLCPLHSVMQSLMILLQLC